MRNYMFFLLFTVFGYSQIPGNGATDIDGNVYTSVIIGTQEWLIENLKVSKFRNGQNISLSGSAAQENSQWCYYQNDENYGNIYGKIYNGNAIIDSRGLAPEGWHIPNNEEWQALIDYLGGNAVAGGKLKSSQLWSVPNTGATNSTGFSAIPGLTRRFDGTFLPVNLMGNFATFWSSSPGSQVSQSPIHLYSLYNDSAAMNYGSAPPSAFYSVRCIKNTILGNPQNDIPSLKIYPNPTRNEINIQIDNGHYLIMVYNVLGQQVLSSAMESNGRFYLADFGKGVYFIKIFDTDAKLIAVKKVIVK